MSVLRVRFGKKMKYLRLKNKLTQGQLAELTGLSVDFIGMVERGLRALSFDNLEIIANVFNVPVSLLFEEAEELAISQMDGGPNDYN